MKNIFKYIIPSLALALTLASCDSTMDDKASIDAKYEGQFKTATISIASVDAPAYNTVVTTCTVGDANDVAEQGIQFSTTNDFTGVAYTSNETVEASFSIETSGLAELTTYYVRAYAVSKNGNVVFSEVQQIKTPEAPATPLNGTYTATEYARSNAGTWNVSRTYKINIEFAEGSTTLVNITNIWGGGYTVQGEYDEESQTITVPSYQIIDVHPSYGDVWIMAILPDFSDYTDAVTFQFTPRGGHMTCTPMAAQCAAGNFSFFYLDMEHDE